MLDRILGPQKIAMLTLQTIESPRLVADFTGTAIPTSDLFVLAEIDLERLLHLIRVARDGATIEVRGLHLAPINVDELARSFARAIKSSRRSPTIVLKLDDAPRRWRKRLVANLCRFGCIEPTEAISP